jgi:hypothetical protein
METLLRREMSGRGEALSEDFGWKCDECGELISAIEDGWVEWLVVESRRGNSRLKGLRLVHDLGGSPRCVGGLRCRYDPHKEFQKGQSLVEGLPLARFVGPDGLMLMLSWIAIGDLPAAAILDLIKRVQIPGYEQARGFFQKGLDEHVFIPSIGKGYYLQAEIRTLLKWTTKTHVRSV